MLNLDGYEVREQIHESLRTVVYRGERRSDGRSVIIKTHRAERPSPSAIARLRHEHEMGSRLRGPTVIEYLAIETLGDGVAVVTEDFGGIDLRDRMAATKGDLRALLSMASTLAEALALVHEQDIIHKDIKPGNIVVNPDTGVYKLIDFGLASDLVRERRGPAGAASMEGTLVYMSPEQTGRTNRAIDHRSDLYSLGMTLYEVACGKPAFSKADPLELVHCHIAKSVEPPHRVDPGVPRAVSDIIMKLVAKNAEERYQTARGLHADLERCRQRLDDGDALAPFALGTRDRPKTLQISQYLYGREQQVTDLLSAFGRVSHGAMELALVLGSAGIGKSSLIAEVHRPMTERRGYFIKGKSDPLLKNTPYVALLQAFGSLLRELLTESESRLQRWRSRLQEALGPNAQLIAEVLPDLRLIVGDTAPVAEVGPAEAQRRFERTFLRFVGVFAHEAHPLVLFLDDLQWSDTTTLRLLGQLLTASEAGHMLIVGAYREEEVDLSHPLSMVLEDVRESDAVVSELKLGPLQPGDVTRLVANTLGSDDEHVRPLAAFVHGKTEGNPLFVGELLRTLHADGLLSFEGERWGWDEGALEAKGLSTSVVGLLVDKVRVLSEPAQRALRIAACMGTAFGLESLSLVTDQPIQEIALILREAIRAGLVQPEGDLYKQAELGMREGDQAQYRFAHDRVREAAYSLLPEGERPAAHWRVGTLLLEKIPRDQREARVFEIVNQIDRGLELATDPAQRVELARLNQLAGNRAFESSAHASALVYFNHAIDLLGDDGFTHEHELTSAVHISACSAAQLSGDFATMERLAEVAMSNATSLLEKVAVHEVQLQAGTARGQLVETLHLGLDVLDALGAKLNRSPGFEDIGAAVGELGAQLAELDDEQLLALPVSDDPLVRAKTRICALLLTVAYSTDPMIYPLLPCQMVKATLEHGNMPESGLGYAAFGVLGSVMSDYHGAKRFADLARRVSDHFDFHHRKAQLAVMIHGVIEHWIAPLHGTCNPLRQAYHRALDDGDIEFGAHCMQIYNYHSLFAGRDLEAVEAEVGSHVATLGRMGQQVSVVWINNDRQVMRNLLGYASDPTRMKGEAYDEEQMVPLHQTHSDLISLFHYHFNTAILSYLYRDGPRAAEHIDKAQPFFQAVKGLNLEPLFHFYDSLIQLVRVREVPAEQREEILTRVGSNQDKLRAWWEMFPDNLEHKWLLVEAERHWYEDEPLEALDAYDKAVALAEARGFRNEAALANERAAEFWRARGKDDIAAVYARAARYCYERWGAKAKVSDLEERYQSVAPVVDMSISTSTSGTIDGRSVMLDDTRQLDMGSVFKATRVISEEMELSRLVTTLMTIVIENAGADRGLLLLGDEGGELRVQASGSVAEDAVRVESGDPGAGADAPRLCEAIVRYVARTKQPVVLQDALNEGLFTQDPYIVEGRVRSVLCMPFSAPMMSQRAAAGVLYLENADTTGVFTFDRVRVLKLITAQAAISVENARLYEDLKAINASLEDQVEERTRELREAQQAFARASRKAGQAEVAENLLHNAGNSLNRLTTTAGALRQAIDMPILAVLDNVVERSKTPDHELAEIFSSSPRAAKLLELLDSVRGDLNAGRERMRKLARSMGEVIDEFVLVVRRHDDYLSASGVTEAFPLGTVLDEAISRAGAAQHPTLSLHRKYRREPVIHSDRYGLEQVFVVLLHHLQQVGGKEGAAPDVLTVRSEWRDDRVQVTVGLGSQTEGREPNPALLKQRGVFAPDMPTLHDSANTVAKLGGSLQSFVGEAQRDVHFVLTLPVGTP